VEKYRHDSVVPFSHSDASKKEQVASMFNQIAFRYDFLNRMLSGGLDVLWRRKAIGQLKPFHPKKLLDVATGTADVAIEIVRSLDPEQVIGIDISEEMLQHGRQKINKLLLTNKIHLERGDSEAINYPDATFDAVTVAFGVRNFENLEKGLGEIHRVLRKNGKLVILEFSKPKLAWFRIIYNIYMKNIAPRLGGMFSKNKDAYQYLHHSVKAFPEGETFLHILQKTGFNETTLKRLTLGICTIYCGTKPEN
jgi:demethylmenaquinone methyltransferase/2-methoxy-6-polyprenyl-1,4-benzoquinol methylase